MTRITSLFVLLALVGCGNKGPLVMADPARDRAVEPAAAVEPAVTEPAHTPPEGTEPPATPEPAATTNGTPPR